MLELVGVVTHEDVAGAEQEPFEELEDGFHRETLDQDPDVLVAGVREIKWIVVHKVEFLSRIIFEHLDLNDWLLVPIPERAEVMVEVVKLHSWRIRYFEHDSIDALLEGHHALVGVFAHGVVHVGQVQGLEDAEELVFVRAKTDEVHVKLEEVAARRYHRLRDVVDLFRVHVLVTVEGGSVI